MDNCRIDVTSEGKDALRLALQLVWKHKQATHYADVRVSRCQKVIAKPLAEGKAPPALNQYPQDITPWVSHICDDLKRDESGVRTLILFWTAPASIKQSSQLPFPLEMEAAPAFVSGWLNSAEFGDEPDIDGSCGKGWRVFNEAWGHVLGDYAAFVAIQPAWAMYGK